MHRATSAAVTLMAMAIDAGPTALFMRASGLQVELVFSSRSGFLKDRSTARAYYRSLVVGAIGVNGIKDEGGTNWNDCNPPVLLMTFLSRFIFKLKSLSGFRWSNLKVVT